MARSLSELQRTILKLAHDGRMREERVMAYDVSVAQLVIEIYD